jgi:hypothetical protein
MKNFAFIVVLAIILFLAASPAAIIITVTSILAVVIAWKKETSKLILPLLLLVSIGLNAQTTTKSMNKTFNASESNVLVLYVPQGLQVNRLGTSKGNTVQIEYVISFETNNDNIVKVLASSDKTPSLRSYKEADAPKTGIIKLHHNEDVIFINGRNIDIKCTSMNVVVPEHIEYFIIKEVEMSELFIK